MLRVNLTTSNMRQYFFIGAKVVEQDSNGFVTIETLDGEKYLSLTPLPKNFNQLYNKEEESWREE